MIKTKYSLYKKVLLLAGVCLMMNAGMQAQEKIDREALVKRHNVINEKYDSLGSLTVGNGRFAFTVDVTGLQSFPEAYAGGVNLGTESEWGWHSFPNVIGYKREDALKTYQFNGRDVSYSVQWNEEGIHKKSGDYFRINEHRLQLGNLGFEILKKDNTPASLKDIQQVHQQLNVWTGEIVSTFFVEGEKVMVSTVANQEDDVISAAVTSALVKSGRLKVFVRYPYPTGAFLDGGTNYASEDKHTSAIVKQGNEFARLKHSLDTTSYFTELSWKGKASFNKKGNHYFLLTPQNTTGQFSFSCRFGKAEKQTIPTYRQSVQSSYAAWTEYWKTGAAVDFKGSTDRRAFELERRIVLSQYLLRVQESGNYPPQETGLTFNSWYGKPHLEMHWWHSAQYAFWNRTELLQKSMDWYSDPVVYNNAKAIATRQGYDGVRWQKMTDNPGTESPSSVGAFLIWQQPHYIYFAEMCYRKFHDKATLEKYKSNVFATADFMASYAHWDSATNRYILGKGLIPAQETFKATETFNPIFELTYWQWALATAQEWRVRCGLPRNKKYDDVMQHLSTIPQINGLYYPAESATDAYTNPKYKTDHPIVVGAMGMLPPVKEMDTAVMRRTFDWVWNNWAWPETWGWDFPLVAMSATRLGMPDKAIDALFMPITTNTYLSNGHNYQDGRLRIYLPGNGALLSAVAMMCAGYDGCTVAEPGIPKDGKWKVRWEGLQKMP
jgi:hypothetical protein